MEQVGGTADVVAYSSAIDACSKAGEPEQALRIFERMVDRGIRPNIVSYSSLARPFARKGDWATVERLGKQMEADGLRMNEYFLYALLDSYTVSKPRQPARAERAFREAMAKGLEANEHVTMALRRVLGREQARALVKETQDQAHSTHVTAPWRR